MYAPVAYLESPDFVKQRAIAMSFINNSLSEKFADYLKKPLTQQYNITTAIEESINNKMLEICGSNGIICEWDNPAICQIYSAQLYRILDYIQKYPCEYLLSDIEKCRQLAFIHSRELASSEYSGIEAKIKLQQSQYIKLKHSKQYTCPKCHKRESIIQEVQLRSFDEGANISAKCINCDHKWIAA